MDICTRFGMEYNPFLKNSKENPVETPELSEAITRLKYIQNIKGIGLLTGEPGVGKTTALRNWAKSLNPSLFKVIYTPLSTLTVFEFYKNIAIEMGLEPQFKKVDNIHLLQNEISRLSIEKHITPVFILDEANYARNAILNDLKILFNFDMDSKDKAIVILAGLTNLNSTLRLSIHEPLRQRIVMNYNMIGLSKEESKSFISSKLNFSGCSKQVFSDNALEAIVNAANGVPRVICKIANACLLIANSKGSDFVDQDIVRLAIDDSDIS